MNVEFRLTEVPTGVILKARSNECRDWQNILIFRPSGRVTRFGSISNRLGLDLDGNGYVKVVNA